MKGKIFLIPCLLGDGEVNQVIPSYVRDVTVSLTHFIVENERSARRYLRKLDIATPIDQLTFYVLDEHTGPAEVEQYIKVALTTQLGILSEAGVPGIADPGSDLVALAHKHGIEVIPLVGPSSILLTQMASGLNGQNFAFNGYLPVDRTQRIRKIKFLEKRSVTEGQTQLFIETPYRNRSLMDDLVQNLDPGTRLCIGVDVTLETQQILTLTVGEWRKKMPDIHKRPAVFSIQG